MNVTRFELGQLGTNSYLMYIDGTESAILVDAPLDASEVIVSKLKKDGKKLVAILLTHGHWDHMWDAKALREMTSAKVYAGALGKEWVEQAHLQKKSLFADGDLQGVQIDVMVYDNDELDIEGVRVKCYEAEGHCPGSIVYYIEGAHKVLFAGDVLFCGSVGRSDFPGGDYDTLMKSIKEKIYTLPSDTVVLPGHGDYTTVEIEKSSNPFVKA